MISTPIYNNKTEEHNSPPIPNPSNLNNNPPILNIATHNVRSFNDSFKQKYLTNLYLLNRLDIIGLQETNFNSNKDTSHLRFSLPPTYVPFLEHKQSTQQVGFGVGLLIKDHLANHIYKHAGNLGRYIYIDLQFPARFKIRIINIYLSSNNPQLRTQTIKEVSEIIRQALSTNMQIILLGDFNAVPNRPNNPSKINEFFALLNSLNLFNTCDLLHNDANTSHPTFHRPNSSTNSRIDHIFVSSALLTGLSSSTIANIEPQYTDHSIVCNKILIPEMTHRTISPKAIKKLTFLYDNITDQQWDAFSKKTDNLLNACHLKNMTPSRLTSIHNVNFYWNHLQNCIIKAAESTLPHKWSANHTQDLRPKALKDDYRQLFNLQKLHRISLQCINRGTVKDSWLNIYNKVKKFASTYDTSFENLHTISTNVIIETLPKIKSLLDLVSTALKIKEDEYKTKMIKEALNQRCENFQSNQSRMIDSILERKRQTIILDRCLDNSLSNSGLLTSEEDVKKETARHFQHAAGPQRSSQEIPEEWIPFYNPLNTVDPSIYNDLMSAPTEDEWNQIIKSLPNDKASGPSKISNELLKHLGTYTNKAYWIFICGCLNLSLTPDAWNLAFVYPIAKPKPWEFNLHNTRPITLLECPRKALVKLINKRLLNILSTNKVLLGNNFAGLPFRSTFEPIHILDNLIYDHHSQQKDHLWFLFQDMSKAYDRVNMLMLLKALQRLHLPLTFCNFIKSLFSSRFNEVFTAHGNTEAYKVISGIDQGEIISPILWCIYYDPLLVRIQQSSLGYNLVSNRHTNIVDSTPTITNAHVPCLAYMDDTLWLSKTKEDLNNIILIADSFYILNDIKVNWDKSLLLTSLPTQTQINFRMTNNNMWLQPNDPNIPVRYLGIWVSIAQNKKFIYQQVKDEISTSATTMKKKKLTDKQLSSIFNAVLIPRILYKIQTTFLTFQFCEMIMGTFRKMFKASLHLSISTPQAVLHSSNIYNLSHLYDQQLQSKITSLQKVVNDPGLLGKTALIRSYHLQNYEWLPSSPFHAWPFSKPSSFKDWWSSILSSMKLLNLSFGIQCSKANITKGGSHPLIDVFNLKLYRKISNHLRRINLLFLSQLTTSNGIYMFPFRDITNNLRHSRQKKRPKWYDILESIVLADQHTRTVHQHLRIEHPCYVASFIPDNNDRTASYLTLWSPALNNSTVGKLLVIDQDTAHIQHFTTTIDDQFQTILDPCFGCTLNDHSTLLKRNMTWRRSLCCFKNPLQLCSMIKLKAANDIGRLCSLSPLMLHEIALNLITANNNYFSITSHTVAPNVSLFDNNTTIQLTNLATNFTNATSLSFYTDGSLRNLGHSTIKMGMAWLQTDPRWPLISFHTSFSLHNPSSTLAELMAVIATIFVSPLNSSITISTDSSSVIFNYNKVSFFLSSSPSLNPIFKISHYPLWFFLVNLINSKHIMLNLIKVKAHADDPLNIQVDRLAKLDKPYCLINSTTFSDVIIPYFYDMPILLPTRAFIKDLLRAQRFNDIIQLPQFDKY